jgi:general stress protein 26
MNTPTSTVKKIEELYQLVADMKIGLFTTRCADGSLETRPMATQKRDPIADLWFVTSIETHKMDDLARDPEINIGYLNHGSMEWVSVSGTVRISQDRAAIKRLYQPDWKIWFDDEGGARNGGPDDPRFALLLVDVQKVHYQKAKHSRPGTLFEIVKGKVTGKEPDIAREEELDVRRG